MATVRMSFAFDALKDHDIIQTLEQHKANGQASQVVRQALRNYFELDEEVSNSKLEETLKKINQRLFDIEQKLVTGSVVVSEQSPPHTEHSTQKEEESSDLANNLGRSLSKFKH